MRRIAAIALLLGLVGTSVSAQPLAPRQIPQKQPVRAHLEIPGFAPFDAELRVKFVDAARVRANVDGSLRSESARALAAVEALARELGLAFAPAIHLPATQLSAFEARAAARSGRAQPDLAGILTVRAPGATPAQLEAIGDALQTLAVVEYAEIAALGVPPPGDIAPPSASFVGVQTYRGPDPGMDADDANARGSTRKKRPSGAPRAYACSQAASISGRSRRSASSQVEARTANRPLFQK